MLRIPALLMFAHSAHIKSLLQGAFWHYMKVAGAVFVVIRWVADNRIFYFQDFVFGCWNEIRTYCWRNWKITCRLWFCRKQRHKLQLIDIGRMGCQSSVLWRNKGRISCWGESGIRQKIVKEMRRWIQTDWQRKFENKNGCFKWLISIEYIELLS